MSEDLTLAMYNRGRYEGAAESARSWKEYAQRLEQELMAAATKLDAEINLSNEVFEELIGEKVKPPEMRLSDPANRQIRFQFRITAQLAAREKYTKAGGPGAIKITDYSLPPPRP